MQGKVTAGGRSAGAPAPGSAGTLDGAPGSFYLATPSDWIHLDVSENGPEAARRLVEGLPTESTPGTARLKAEVTSGLQQAIRQARSQGAVMAAFWFLPIQKHTLGASLTVAFAPLGPGRLMVGLGAAAREHAAAGLAEVLGRGGDVEAADVVELPVAGHAARIRRRTTAAALGEQRDAVVVQYYVPVPQAPRMLVMTFATPTLELVEPITDLFDALAASLRWRP